MELYHDQGKGGSINWVKIAQHMGGTRSPEQCRMHWRNEQKPKRETRAGAWSPEEVHRSLIMRCVVVNSVSIECLVAGGGGSL